MSMVFLFCSYECTLLYFKKQSIFCSQTDRYNWQFVQNQKSQCVHNQFQCFYCNHPKAFSAQSDLLVSCIYNLRHTLSKFIFVLQLDGLLCNSVSKTTDFSFPNTMDWETVHSRTPSKNLKRSFSLMSQE